MSLKAPRISVTECTPLQSTSSKEQSQLKSQVLENPILLSASAVHCFEIDDKKIQNEEDKNFHEDPSEHGDDLTEQPINKTRSISGETHPVLECPEVSIMQERRERVYSMQSDFSNVLR